jgi:hypothetical protein
MITVTLTPAPGGWRAFHAGHELGVFAVNPVVEAGRALLALGVKATETIRPMFLGNGPSVVPVTLATLLAPRPHPAPTRFGGPRGKHNRWTYASDSPSWQADED